jgi:hypothetical protein
MISSPLLNIPSELEETSYRLFKYLMSYMGDRRSAKKPIKNVKKHIQMWKQYKENERNVFFFFGKHK